MSQVLKLSKIRSAIARQKYWSVFYDVTKENHISRTRLLQKNIVTIFFAQTPSENNEITPIIIGDLEPFKNTTLENSFFVVASAQFIYF